MTSEDILDKALDQYLTNTPAKPISPSSRLPRYAAAATAILAGTHTDAAIVELGPILSLISQTAFAGSSTGSSSATSRNSFALTTTNNTINASVVASLRRRTNTTGGGGMQYSNYVDVRIQDAGGDVKFATSAGRLRIMNYGDPLAPFGTNFIQTAAFIGQAGFGSSGTGTFGFVLANNPLNPQNFGTPPRGLIGVSFQKGGNTHYGWIELAYEVNPAGGAGPLGGIQINVDIVNRAWETTPNTSLGAGVIPEPSSLGLLALGFTGVLMQRRRKQAAA